MKQRAAFFPSIPLAALLLVLVPTISPSLHAGESSRAAEAQQAFAEAVRSQRLQTEFPLDEEDMKKASRNFGAGGSGVEISEKVAGYMLWTAAALFTIIIVLAIIDNLRSQGRSFSSGHAKKSAEQAAVAVQARMAVAQREAEALAENGDFAEAMHVLLLQALGEMRRRLSITIAQSLTSREILHRVELASEARSALADMVGRVEISYFGTHAPGKEEYEACRNSYVTITSILRGGDGA